MNKPVAFVIPWYGESLKGGAEQFAWQFSHRLAARGHSIEILTSCCASFLDDWNQNHFEAGEERISKNIVVRRFEVRERDSHAFHQANMNLLENPLSQLRSGDHSGLGEAGEIFACENIRSEALNTYLADHAEDYAAFIFIPYMYGPTFDGLPLVADRAYLHPCLHDEAYAYLPQVEALFTSCKGILYNSLGEKFLAEKMYGPGIHDKGFVVGGGVEITTEQEAVQSLCVAGKDLGDARFILYLGRRDNTKNTDLLVTAFRRYRSRDPASEILLCLAGPGTNNYTDEGFGILDFGLVSESDKGALLAHCLALMQPSSNESYSRSLMEAWLHGKPVGVHADCLATSDPVEQAAGGWVARDEISWATVIDRVDKSSAEELASLGRSGRQYALQYASWDRAIDRYESALELVTSAEASRPAGKLRKVVQLTAGITRGDAISNQALYIRDCLVQAGYETEILVETLDPLCHDEARVYEHGMLDEVDAIIYHHSIGSSLGSISGDFTGPKALIYHNITPAEYFAPYDKHVASLLASGRDELRHIVHAFSALWGDSQYNVDELLALGDSQGAVLPIAVSPGLWVEPPCRQVVDSIRDGKRNILFVGRVSPNKCQEDLVRAFKHYRALDPQSRLILVGGYDPAEKYYQRLRQVIDESELGENVLITGKVSQSQLHAYYRGSHLFWSMSEHEGFGVPLVESMWFELPVMAYKSSAVAETLAQGGITFDDKTDLAQLALLAFALLHNEQLSRDLIAGQRLRRLDFHPGKVSESLGRLLLNLEKQGEEGEGRRAL